MADDLKRIPLLSEIFGADIDKTHSKIWSEFARSMVDWGNFDDYASAMAHIRIAFDAATRLFGRSAALTVYQAITEDVQLLPNEILRAAKYVYGGGDKAAVTELVAESYFLDCDHSEELTVDFHLAAYEPVYSADVEESDLKEFEVTITETLTKKVFVEANDRDEAAAIVAENWDNGDYILDAESFAGVVFSSPVAVDTTHSYEDAVRADELDEEYDDEI